MAFRPLTEAECGQKNPLLRLTSHITQDHALSENHGHLFPGSSDQLVEQFLQETRAIPQSFRMDDLMREMHEIESQRSALPPVPASAVKEHLHDDAWAQQYIEDGKVFHSDVNNEATWAEIMSKQSGESTGASQFDDWIDNNLREEGLVGESNWAQIQPRQFWVNYQEPQPGPSLIQQSARELTDLVADDTKFEYSKFMKFMKQVGDAEISLEDGKMSEQEVQSWSEEFMKSDLKEGDILDENWPPKQSVRTEDDYFKSQFWDNLQEELKEGLSNDTGEHPWLTDYESYLGGAYKDYVFSDDNPMFDIAKPLERGKQFLQEGDVPSAVLCFEAAVKQEPENAEAWLLLGKTQAENEQAAVKQEAENAEAWLLLGKTQAENEQDPNAIPALKKCLQIEPNNLEALMALAVSYTNESYYSQAGQTLVKWLMNNPKYGDLVPADFKFSGQVTSFLHPDQHKIIQDLFIKAAQRQPLDVDYEVQCGLGVLCNVSGEYDKAADCFKAALSVNPNDAKLWNRLGATLANGNKSEKAVEAYHRALTLEPGFIRARYNVGIVCINLRAYKEAAEHFLTALNQQSRGKDIASSGTMSQMSDTIWSTLRMCISLLNRGDLRTAVDNKDLQILNEAFEILDN